MLNFEGLTEAQLPVVVDAARVFARSAFLAQERLEQLGMSRDMAMDVVFDLMTKVIEEGPRAILDEVDR